MYFELVSAALQPHMSAIMQTIIDPTDFRPDNPHNVFKRGLVSQAVCLTIFNLSPTQKTCVVADCNKASECVHSGPSANMFAQTDL